MPMQVPEGQEIGSAMTAPEVVELLTRYRFRFKNENELQQGIGVALTRANVHHQIEVRLDAESRLDFLCEGGLAIEVKVSGNFSRASLVRQISRYSLSERVASILVVSNKIVDTIPGFVNGKSVHVHYLLGSML